MKKTILLFIFIFSSYTSFGQILSNLNVSPTGDDLIVDVNLISYVSTISEFINEEHSLVNNIITMDVCYYVTGFQVGSSYDHTFPVTVPADGNYTLIVNLYRSETQSVCDYTELTDTATLDFTTPLIDTVYLGVAEFKEVSNQITVFPNPVKDFLNIKISGSLDIKNIEIYNMLGSQIKSFSNNFESLDVRGISNGMYFLKCSTNKGIVKKRILVNN